jgi:hypothetical protein
MSTVNQKSKIKNQKWAKPLPAPSPLSGHGHRKQKAREHEACDRITHVSHGQFPVELKPGR